MSLLTLRAMLRLLPVQVLLSAIGAVNGTVTGLFAANAAGTEAMSAVGLYVPVNYVVMAVSMFLSSGAVILCGQYMGRNEKDKIRNVFFVNLLAAAILPLALTAFLLVMALCTDGFLTKDPEIRPIFRACLTGMSLGIVPTVLGNQTAAFLSLENRVKRTTAASIAFIIANVIFNFLFQRVLRLEALGLALASACGGWVFFLTEAQGFLQGRGFSWFRSARPEWKEIPHIVSIGLPDAFSNVYRALRSLIVNGLIVAYVGAVGLSACAAANSLPGLFRAVPAGMLSVSRMLMSVAACEEDRQTLTHIMRGVLSCYVVLMCLISLFISLMANPLTSLYYHDPADPVYMLTVWTFRILPWCMPLSTICMQFTGCWQNAGRNLPVHLLTLLDGLVSVSFFSWLLTPQLGLNGVNIANILNGLVSLAVILLYASFVNKGFPKNMEELMAIPEDFGVPESERLPVTVQNSEDVLNISKAVWDFCKEHSIDERRTCFASLAMEEMAGSVVEHGFRKDRRKHHTANVRVTHKGDRLSLMIHDDCIAFDPYERLDVYDPDDMMKNTGIRMVYAIADEVNYQNILGMNVLTIEI